MKSKQRFPHFLPKKFTKRSQMFNSPDNFFKYIVYIFFALALLCVILHIASFLIVYVVWFVFITLIITGVWLILKKCKL